MDILLIGHGRMGQLIEQTALSAGDRIAGAVDINNLCDLSTLPAADVAMDFSSPAVLPAAADYVRRTGTPYLSGTTGLAEADQQILTDLGQFAPVLYSANYSVGIAVFARVLRQISDVLKPDFDIEMTETHHNQKVDAPSGTAKLLLQAIDPAGELTPVYGREGLCGKRGEREIGIHALRGGTVAGEHTVSFFGVDEILEIRHQATSRQIFVNGALHMARKLSKMPKGRYDLQELLFGGGVL
jgi:4-hydroxy-tetrahydrodipicolinate reductase